jgi:hypothetical protein
MDYDDTEHALYENCSSIEDSYFYNSTDRNGLNIDLYNELVSNPLLDTYKHIRKGKINEPEEFLPGELFLIGNIAIRNFEDLNWICKECQLRIPVDMDFYSNSLQEEFDESLENYYSLKNGEYTKLQCVCKLCYDTKKHSILNTIKINSGLDSIADWVYIFGTIHYEFLYNINTQSTHYKKFMRSIYLDGAGEAATIKPELSLDEIFNKYDISRAP